MVQQIFYEAENWWESLASNPETTPPSPGLWSITSSLWHPAPLGLKGQHLIFCCSCFALFFSFTLFPGRLSKATFCHQGTQEGQGGHLRFPKPLTPEGSGGGGFGGGGDIYLFISSCCAPHPPSCCSLLGKMKNGFRQWRTRLATWPPQFNFL